MVVIHQTKKINKNDFFFHQVGHLLNQKRIIVPILKTNIPRKYFVRNIQRLPNAKHKFETWAWLVLTVFFAILKTLQELSIRWAIQMHLQFGTLSWLWRNAVLNLQSKRWFFITFHSEESFCLFFIRFSHLIYQRQHNLAPNVFSSDELQAVDHMLSKKFLIYHNCMYNCWFFSAKSNYIQILWWC